MNSSRNPAERGTRRQSAIELGLLLEAEPTLTLDDVALRLGRSVGWVRKLRDVLARELGTRIEYDRVARLWQVKERGALPLTVLSPGDVTAILLTMDEINVRTDGVLAPRAISATRRMARQVLGADYAAVAKRTLTRGALRELDAPAWGILERAVADCLRVRMTYDSADSGKRSTFTADPLQLFFAECALYVDVVIQPEDELRMLRVQRIVEVAIMGQGAPYPGYDFRRRRRYMFRSWGPSAGQTDPVDVHLEVRGRSARYVDEVRWHETEVKRWEGDVLYLSVTVWKPEEVVWWSARWGADCRVVGPPGVVEAARKWWAEAAQVHAANRASPIRVEVGVPRSPDCVRRTEADPGQGLL